jgi:hypothetical protein
LTVDGRPAHFTIGCDSPAKGFEVRFPCGIKADLEP